MKTGNRELVIFAMGICPALAVSNIAATGLGIGVEIAAVLFFSVTLAVIIKKYCPVFLRKPLAIISIALIITAFEWGSKKLLPDMSYSFGIYLPLIAANFLIMSMSGLYSSPGIEPASIKKAFLTGIAVIIVLGLTGIIREFLGKEIPSPAGVFLMPAGGFLVTGLLLALFQSFNKSGSDNNQSGAKE
jgi:electron transport complex protein RnfE